MTISEPIRITVNRGDETSTDSKTFSIQRRFLKSSDFFEACLRGDWAEKNNNAIELNETDPEIFKAYVDWLYTKDLPDQKLSRYEIDFSDYITSQYDEGDWLWHESHSAFVFFIQCYLLGEQLQDMAFRNAAMDQLRSGDKTWRCHEEPDGIGLAYENLPNPTSSKLWQFLILEERTNLTNWRQIPELVQWMQQRIPDQWFRDVRDNSLILPRYGSKEALFHEHSEKVPESECAACRARS